MGKEIEHKYLVVGDGYKTLAKSVHHIRQGDLSTEKERTVRVRIYDDKGFITVKGANHGDTRLEFEYEIPVADAENILDELCLPGSIDKNRYIVDFEGNTWEVDEFLGALAGLVLAEIELECSEQSYSKPDFIGKNVTGDSSYYNSNLMNHRCNDL